MDLKNIAKDTAKVLISYLTYRAMRVVVAQLSETNPPLSIWLGQFSSTGRVQDGEAYLNELIQENKDLAFRIMTVRAHLADEVAEFLPEMVQSGIQQANIEHRREYLERITQLQMSDTLPSMESTPESDPESDS